jgi:hypothetical protein
VGAESIGTRFHLDKKIEFSYFELAIREIGFNLSCQHPGWKEYLFEDDLHIVQCNILLQNDIVTSVDVFFCMSNPETVIDIMLDKLKSVYSVCFADVSAGLLEFEKKKILDEYFKKRYDLTSRGLKFYNGKLRSDVFWETVSR